MTERTAEDFFASNPLGLAVHARVLHALRDLGPVDVRVSKSQVAFRRKRGFAFLWVPGQYLHHPAVDVVLTIALGRHDPSARFKEVVHPSPTQWIHHLEVRSLDDIDDEVVAWLREAADRAS